MKRQIRAQANSYGVVVSQRENLYEQYREGQEDELDALGATAEHGDVVDNPLLGCGCQLPQANRI